MRMFTVVCASLLLQLPCAASAAEGPSLSIGDTRVTIGADKESVIQQVATGKSNQAVSAMERDAVAVLNSDRELIGTVYFKNDVVASITSIQLVPDASALFDVLHKHLGSDLPRPYAFVSIAKKHADVDVISIDNERVSIELRRAPLPESAPVRDVAPDPRVQVSIRLR